MKLIDFTTINTDKAGPIIAGVGNGEIIAIRDHKCSLGHEFLVVVDPDKDVERKHYCPMCDQASTYMSPWFLVLTDQQVQELTEQHVII